MNAARTDDLLTILQTQLALLPDVPKMIAGDINGAPEAFTTFKNLTNEEGWTDVGMGPRIFNGDTGR